MAESIVFIGLGRMGAPMALHVLKAGHALAVADLSEATFPPFVHKGCPASTRAADLPGEIVITMLPMDRHVREALLGEGGACTGGQRRSVVIDMSTASPEGTRALAAELAALGIAMLDAPVSGGMAGAERGTLTAMVGGDAATFARCRPILEAMCRTVEHVGPSGSGHIVKALNNYLSAATLWTATEALTVGTRLGLDPAAMLRTWTSGTGRSHATEVKLPDHVLPGTFDFGQTLELFCKDIAIAAGIAGQSGAETPALAALQALWLAARERLGPADDITAIARNWERTTGSDPESR